MARFFRNSPATSLVSNFSHRSNLKNFLFYFHNSEAAKGMPRRIHSNTGGFGEEYSIAKTPRLIICTSVLFVPMRLKTSLPADHSMPYQILALPMRCDGRLTLDRVLGRIGEKDTVPCPLSLHFGPTKHSLRFFFSLCDAYGPTPY